MPKTHQLVCGRAASKVSPKLTLSIFQPNETGEQFQEMLLVLWGGKLGVGPAVAVQKAVLPNQGEQHKVEVVSKGFPFDGFKCSYKIKSFTLLLELVV